VVFLRHCALYKFTYLLTYLLTSVDGLLNKTWTLLQVTVAYRDIDLAMTSQEARDCTDWLLLQSVGFKNSAAITCGHLLNIRDRQLTSRANRLLLHFHSAHHHTNELPLKGFRVLLTGK